MSNQNNMSKASIVKLTFVILVVLGFIVAWNMPDTDTEKNTAARKAMLTSLEGGGAQLTKTNKLLVEAGVYGEDVNENGTARIPVTASKNPEVILCPQYILPVLPELPELPPKDVMDTVSRDQLNFILYQHIKAHQNRTVEVRKRIFQSYANYLESCE